MAQEPAAPAAAPSAPVSWESLSPQQQKLLGTRFGGQWNTLPPERQQALARGSQRWLGMTPDAEDPGARPLHPLELALPPEQRQALRQRWQQFQALPPQQRAFVRQNFHRFQQLPPARRQMLMQRWHNATPEQRKEMVERAPGPPAGRRARGRRAGPAWATAAASLSGVTSPDARAPESACCRRPCVRPEP